MTKKATKAKAAPVKLKVSEWLAECGSHDIYNAAQIAQDFTERTGEAPCWATHTVAATAQAMKARGLGGTLRGKPQDVTAWGYEIAGALARKYANFTSEKMGRGFLFFDCLEALRRAGK